MMKSTVRLSRRDVMCAGAACAIIPTLTRVATGAETGKITVHVFSKHLQWLDYDGMAETAAEIGFDGIDLTVRLGGHVLPERVEDDLPRAFEAARKTGVPIIIMATGVNDPRDPRTEPILRTAGRLGIRYYRMGYYRYDRDKPIPAQLAEFKPMVTDLVAMNREYGVAGTYQNHAGAGYVGAPLWDLYMLLKDCDRRWLGCQYDIRHATVEGGTAWPTTLRLLAPRINTLVAKDFCWGRDSGRWRAENCPLGEGAVDFPAYFKALGREDVAGPMSLHLEYDLGGAEHGDRKLTTPEAHVINAMRKDLSTLRAWLKQRSP